MHVCMRTPRTSTFGIKPQKNETRSPVPLHYRGENMEVYIIGLKRTISRRNRNRLHNFVPLHPPSFYWILTQMKREGR